MARFLLDRVSAHKVTPRIVTKKKQTFAMKTTKRRPRFANDDWFGS
jgi:hypothetical protein